MKKSIKRNDIFVLLFLPHFTNMSNPSQTTFNALQMHHYPSTRRRFVSRELLFHHKSTPAWGQILTNLNSQFIVQTRLLNRWVYHKHEADKTYEPRSSSSDSWVPRAVILLSDLTLWSSLEHVPMLMLLSVICMCVCICWSIATIFLSMWEKFCANRCHKTHTSNSISPAFPPAATTKKTLGVSRGRKHSLLLTVKLYEVFRMGIMFQIVCRKEKFSCTHTLLSLSGPPSGLSWCRWFDYLRGTKG